MVMEDNGWEKCLEILKQALPKELESNLSDVDNDLATLMEKISYADDLKGTKAEKIWILKEIESIFFYGERYDFIEEELEKWKKDYPCFINNQEFEIFLYDYGKLLDDISSAKCVECWQKALQDCKEAKKICEGAEKTKKETE